MRTPFFFIPAAIAFAAANVHAQNVVFQDALTGDSLDAASYPAVSGTTTGWDILTNKNAPSPAESGGVLTVNMAGTSSGFAEAQALFSAAPVQLLPGTYLELIVTFSPTFVLSNASDNLSVGLFNSAGSPPLGTLLNSGLSSGLATAATGGAKGWTGYNARFPISGSPSLLTRAPQTATNNTVQDVVVDSQSTSVGYSSPAGVSASGITAMTTTLTNGSTYTLDYQLSLSGDGLTLTAAASLYNGVGTAGAAGNTLIGSFSGKFSGATLLTKSFDALALGWRADAGTSNPSSVKISAVTVQTTGGAPWVVAQPPANLSASVGSSVTIAATVAGSVAAYQWQLSVDGGSTYANLDTAANPTAATASLTLGAAQNSDAGLYRLVVTNPAGSTISTPTLLAVTSSAVAPTITTNPVSATVLGGTAQTFSAAANGTAPLAFQWQKSTDGVTFVALAGGTGPSYSIAAASLSDEGYYRVTVTNAAGMATSGVAQLTVNQPLAITSQPAGAALVPGSAYTLAVGAVGRPAPAYQWSLNGAAIPGATGSTYTIASAAATDAGLYAVLVTNAAGDSVTSAGAGVAVLSPSLATIALMPAAGGGGVIPDTRLTLTFNQPVAIGRIGTIKIYDTANPATPVDTIDLVAATALMKTLRAANPAASIQALPVQNKPIGGVTNFNYYPITVSGNTATIYPRNNVLATGKSYYVTIDPGVFTDVGGLAYAGISDPSAWRFATRTAGPASGATFITVAADGSGDFCTVQGALDFVPAGNTTPRTLFVRKGTYFEEIYFTGKHSLTFLGEDRSQSLIVYPNNNNFNNVGGTYHRMVLNADHANNVAFVNLSITNSTPKGGAQAEALILNGSAAAQGLISNVTLFSYQDTLQINGQAYVTASHISGDVDFIWGGGPCFFDHCEITQLSSGAYFTQIRNGTANHGYVFSSCHFDAAAGVAGSFLGRIDPTGFPNSETVYLDSSFGDATNNAFLNTSTAVSGSNYLAGWWLLNNAANAAPAGAVHDWTNNLADANGAPLINPNGDAFTAMPADAATQANYRSVPWVLGTSLSGAVFSTWSPSLAPVVASAPAAQTLDAGSGFTLSVQAFGVPAVSYQWSLNGAPIAGANAASYTVASATALDAGTYAVTVSNASGSVTTAAVPLVIHHAPPVIALQPANTTGLPGATATLNVWAVGDAPLAYQWYKDGAPVAGANRASLRLAGLADSSAGQYSVSVSNAAGATASGAATLTLVPPATTLPALPNIPAATFDVTAFGAVGDGATDNTAAIQAAITAAKQAGGGTIEVPPAQGAYLCGPITLSSQMDLQVDGGAILQALPFGTYPGSQTSPSHFITVSSGATDVELSGGGTIDGNGAPWWAAYNAGTISNRPRLVQITKASNVLFSGVTFSNSPSFHLAFSGLNNNVTIFGVTISAPGNSPNTDGMDIAGTNFLVQNCSVADGDDNIVAKPGSVFCRNLYISGCAIGTGHGVSIGGQTNVGLDGMVVTNCSFSGTSSALRMKADPTEGGPVQNVTFSHLTMTNVTYPILFYSYYNLLGSPGATSGSSEITPARADADNLAPPTSLASATLPSWKNITLSDITVTNGSGYSTIWGLPLADGLIQNVTFNNVNLGGEAGLELYDAANIQFTGTNNVGPVVTANALAITGQPQGASVSVGASVNFTTSAAGASGANGALPTYQWSLNGAALTDGTLPDGTTVSGSNGPTLAFGNVHVAEAGSLICTVSNTLDGYSVAAGGLLPNSLPVSAASAAAVLAVQPLPASIALSGLATTYNGAAQNPAVVTSPPGLPVTFVYNGDPTVTATTAGTYAVVATITDPNYIGTGSGQLVIAPASPALQWASPAAIVYGTPLDAAQLNAAASTPGTLTYTPAAGTVLGAGAGQTLTVTFTPADATDYTPTSATVALTVNPAPVTFAFGNTSQVFDGTPRAVAVTANPASAAFALTYGGSASAPIAAGTYALVATANGPNYAGSASATLTVAQAVPRITWPTPAAITYGTPLGSGQLNATANVSGAFAYAPAAGTVLNAGAGQILSAHFIPADGADYTAVGASTALTVNKATATITLSGLSQRYDGAAKAIAAATSPAGLTVDITYAGGATPPTLPGSYPVVATIDDANYSGTASGTLTIGVTALLRHAPTLDGDIDGSAEVVSPESVTLNGNAMIAASLLVPGTPALVFNGHPKYGSTLDGGGSSSPSGYTVTLNGNAVLGHVVRRVDPISLPAVAAPAAPAGTRDVALNSAGQSAGDFGTVRNLTLNGKAGAVAVPPGSYGAIVVNDGSTLILGSAGGAVPAVYDLQGLTLNGKAALQIAGPVVLTCANAVTLNGAVGASSHPEWLSLQVFSGGVTLNGNATLSGTIIAPSGTVTVNGNATLQGSVVADRLTLNGNAVLEDPTP